MKKSKFHFAHFCSTHYLTLFFYLNSLIRDVIKKPTSHVKFCMSAKQRNCHRHTSIIFTYRHVKHVYKQCEPNRKLSNAALQGFLLTLQYQKLLCTFGIYACITFFNYRLVISMHPGFGKLVLQPNKQKYWLLPAFANR